MTAPHERVTKHLDETEHIAQFDLQSGDPMEAGRARWQLQAWLPSLRRRAGRHRHDSGRTRDDGRPACTHCGIQLWPCPDYRDLCVEIGIDPGVSQ